MRLSKSTILFGIFIVISASFTRQILDFLYTQIGQETTATLLGISFAIIFLTINFQVIRLPIQTKRKIIFFILFATGLSLSWQLKIVAERIHVLEYGLLGYLASRDLLKRSISIKPILLVILVVASFALLDEGFQHILPNRFWDLRDIVFNLCGGILGTSLFLIINKEKK